MDAAKAMWIFYEHPELKTMESVLPPNEFPKTERKSKTLLHSIYKWNSK